VEFPPQTTVSGGYAPQFLRKVAGQHAVLQAPLPVSLLNSGKVHSRVGPEIKEVLLQTAVYCGLPAAGEAFKVAEGVLQAGGHLD